MKYLFLSLIVLSTMPAMQGCGQEKQQDKNFNAWRKAVFNIEVESFQYPKYYIDSLYALKKSKGGSASELDSINRLFQHSIMGTGTAIYIQYKDRKYIVTAKHVIYDKVLAEQKRKEIGKGVYRWDNADAIFTRVSIRTPFDFFFTTGQINTQAIINNNFLNGFKPFFFISDTTGDGIGVISLQYDSYKSMDSLLQKNGYAPIQLESIIGKNEIHALDEIYTIGFPEMVSIFGNFKPVGAVKSIQSTDVVLPFAVKGSIAMYNENVSRYYIDMKTAPGNSGSPVIKDGELIGIITGINRPGPCKEGAGTAQKCQDSFYGIYFTGVMKVEQLMDMIGKYYNEESKVMKK